MVIILQSASPTGKDTNQYEDLFRRCFSLHLLFFFSSPPPQHVLSFKCLGFHLTGLQWGLVLGVWQIIWVWAGLYKGHSITVSDWRELTRRAEHANWFLSALSVCRETVCLGHERNKGNEKKNSFSTVSSRLFTSCSHLSLCKCYVFPLQQIPHLVSMYLNLCRFLSILWSGIIRRIF